MPENQIHPVSQVEAPKVGGTFHPVDAGSVNGKTVRSADSAEGLRSFTPATESLPETGIQDIEISEDAHSIATAIEKTLSAKKKVVAENIWPGVQLIINKLQNSEYGSHIGKSQFDKISQLFSINNLYIPFHHNFSELLKHYPQNQMDNSRREHMEEITKIMNQVNLMLCNKDEIEQCNVPDQMKELLVSIIGGNDLDSSLFILFGAAIIQSVNSMSFIKAERAFILLCGDEFKGFELYSDFNNLMECSAQQVALQQRNFKARDELPDHTETTGRYTRSEMMVMEHLIRKILNLSHFHEEEQGEYKANPEIIAIVSEIDGKLQNGTYGTIDKEKGLGFFDSTSSHTELLAGIQQVSLYQPYQHMRNNSDHKIADPLRRTWREIVREDFSDAICESRFRFICLCMILSNTSSAYILRTIIGSSSLQDDMEKLAKKNEELRESLRYPSQQTLPPAVQRNQTPPHDCSRPGKEQAKKIGTGVAVGCAVGIGAAVVAADTHCKPLSQLCTII